MGKRRETRELALQTLYQLDARAGSDLEQIERSAQDSPHDAATREAGWTMAQAAWANRDRADALTTELAPKWPPNRQPTVDRCILRLAYHELATETAAPAVVIDEAVELAKRYGSERSPAFINGVLDRMARRLRETEAASGDGPEAADRDEGEASDRPEQTDRSASDDPWLDDALRRARTTR